MMIRCQNQKINDIINKATGEAVTAFLESITLHTKDIPEGEVEGLILMNSLIIGVSKIIANTIYLSTPVESHIKGINALINAARMNAIEILEAKVQDDDNSV